MEEGYMSRRTLNQLISRYVVDVPESPQTIFSERRSQNATTNLARSVFARRDIQVGKGPFRIACINGNALPRDKRIFGTVFDIAHEHCLSRVDVGHALLLWKLYLRIPMSFRELVVCHPHVWLPRKNNSRKTRGYLLTIAAQDGDPLLTAIRVGRTRYFFEDTVFAFFDTGTM